MIEHMGQAVAGRQGARLTQTRYSEEIHKKIVKAIRKGNSLRTASTLAGLGKDTIHDWIAHGRKRPEEYPHFARLVADIEKVQAEREAEHVAKIERVALSDEKNTWQASAWWLERRNPQDWGRKDKVHVENQSPVVQLNQVIIADGDTREEARSLLRRATAIDASAHESLGPGVRGELEAGDSGSPGQVS